MEAVKAFNAELCSLYELKPPVSKGKMTQITKTAMKAIKFYKHVVQSVEKFIQKCRPEYKVPGLYVIDSIIRQSRKLFGPEKDVFASRFSKNIVITFANLFTCPTEDLSRIIRVLNLWQKNGVYSAAIVQPLLDLSTDPLSSVAFERVQEVIESVTGLTPSMPLTRCDQKPPALTADALQLGTSLETKPDNHLDLLKVVAQLMQPSVSTPQPVVTPQSVQLQLLQQLLMHQTQMIPELAQPSIDASMLTRQLQDLAHQILGSNAAEMLDSEARQPEHSAEQAFDKKLLEFDYGESDDENGRRNMCDRSSQRVKDSLEESNDQIENGSISENLNHSTASCEKVNHEPEEANDTENDGNAETTGAEKLADSSAFEQEDGECTSEEEEEEEEKDITPEKEVKSWREDDSWQRRCSDSGRLDDSSNISKNVHIDEDSSDGEESDSSSDKDDEHGQQVDDDTDDSSSGNHECSTINDGKFKESQRQSSDDDCIILDSSSSSSSVGEHLHQNRRKNLRRSRHRSSSLQSHSRSSSRGRSRKIRRKDKQHDSSDSETKEKSAEWLRAKKEHDRKSQGLPPLKDNHLSICSTTIWIGHLSKQTTEDDLQDELCKYGEATINLIPPRGCAFVCFNTRKEASKALEMLKGVKVAGNTLKVAWAPGVGIKESAFRKLCDIELGVTYIPWIKIPANIEPLLNGGILDEDSLPPSFHSQSENNETRLEMDLSQDSAEGQDGETGQQSFMSSSDIPSVTSMVPALSSMQPIPEIPPIMPPPVPLLAPHLILSTPVIPNVGISPHPLVMPLPQPMPAPFTQPLMQPLPSSLPEESKSFTLNEQTGSQQASDISTSFPVPTCTAPLLTIGSTVPGFNETVLASYRPAATWMSTAFGVQSPQAVPVMSYESQRKLSLNHETTSVVVANVAPSLSVVENNLPAMPGLQQPPCSISSGLPKFDPTKPPPFFVEQQGHPRQFADSDQSQGHSGKSKSNDNIDLASNFSEASQQSGVHEMKGGFTAAFVTGFPNSFRQDCKLNAMPFQSSNLPPSLGLNHSSMQVHSERHFKDFLSSNAGFEPTPGVSGPSKNDITIETSKEAWNSQNTLPNMMAVRDGAAISFGSRPLPCIPISNSGSTAMPSMFNVQGLPFKEPPFVQDSAIAEGRHRELPSDVPIWHSQIIPVSGNNIPGPGEFRPPSIKLSLQNILQGPSDQNTSFPHVPLANEHHLPYACKPTSGQMTEFNERSVNNNEQMFPRKNLFNSDMHTVQPSNMLPGPRVQSNLPGLPGSGRLSGSERFGGSGNVGEVMAFGPRSLSDPRPFPGPQGMVCPGGYAAPVSTVDFRGMPSNESRSDNLVMAGQEQRSNSAIGFGSMAGIAGLTGPGIIGTPGPESVTGPLGTTCPERMKRNEDLSCRDDYSNSQFSTGANERPIGCVQVSPAVQSAIFPFTKSHPHFQPASPLQSPRIFASRFESMSSQKTDFHIRNPTLYCGLRMPAVTNDNQTRAFASFNVDQRHQDMLQNHERNMLAPSYGSNNRPESSVQVPFESWQNKGSAEQHRSSGSLTQMRYESRLQLPQAVPASFSEPRFFQMRGTEWPLVPQNQNARYVRNSLADLAQSFAHQTNHSRMTKEQS